jgi:hypothetical protein
MTPIEKEILRTDLKILGEISECLMGYVLILLFIGIVCGIGIIILRLLGL